MYVAILNTPDYKTTNATFVNSPLLVNDGCSILNGCYGYNVNVTTALRSQRYYSIEPASNQIPYTTYTVEVKDESPISHTVYRSVTSGFVIGPFSLPGSILVAHSVNVNNAMVGMDPIIQLLFLKSFQEWQQFPLLKNQTDIVSYNVLFHDTQSNIGAILASNSVIPPEGVNGKLPQVADIYTPFLYENPIRPITEFIVTLPSISINQREYYLDWNGAWNSVPLDLSAPFYEYSRVWWIYHQLERYEKLTYYDLRDLMIKISDTKLLATGRGDVDELGDERLVAQSDAFLLLRERFAEAIHNNPTPLCLSLLSELLAYDGSFIGGDINNRLTSMNIPDTWLCQCILNFIGPAAPLVINQGSVPWDVLFFAVPLLINPCNNPIFYTGYPGYNNKVLQDQIITESLDDAYNDLIVFLGPRPWGIDKRFEFPFNNEFVGTVDTIPWIQHVAINTRGILAHGISIGPGITDKIIDTPLGILPDPSMINLTEQYQFFRMPDLGGKLKPGKCFRNMFQERICQQHNMYFF